MSLTDGPTDTCATIDDAVFVSDPSGRAIRSVLGGCVDLTTDPVATADTYSVFVTPHPLCACSFDYEIVATKN